LNVTEKELVHDDNDDDNIIMKVFYVTFSKTHQSRNSHKFRLMEIKHNVFLSTCSLTATPAIPQGVAG